jgi:uncharacterized protein CbrC (UPF0167 family)
VYAGPAESEKHGTLSGMLCPWCVADGSAARRFEASFTDATAVTGVPEIVQEALETRTPGIAGMGHKHWVGCCGDATAYLGRVGAEELRGSFAPALPAVREAMERQYQVYGEERDRMVDGLRRNGASAYVFQCLHCNTVHAYFDDVRASERSRRMTDMPVKKTMMPATMSMLNVPKVAQL